MALIGGEYISSDLLKWRNREPSYLWRPQTATDVERTMSEIQKMAFSVDEAAFRADLGRDALYHAIREGRLEAKKNGRRTLITAEALRRYLESLPALQLPPAA